MVPVKERMDLPYAKREQGLGGDWGRDSGRAICQEEKEPSKDIIHR